MHAASGSIVPLTGRNFLYLLIASGIYFLSARFAVLLFSLEPGNIALIWLPSGIGLLMVLRFGYWAVPFVVAASFIANSAGMAAVLTEHAWLHTSIAALSNGVESTLAAALMRRFLPEGLQSFQDIFPFVFGVCLVSTAANSTILFVNLVSAGFFSIESSWMVWLILIVTNSLGMLLLVPLAQSLLQAWTNRRAMSLGEASRCTGLFIMCTGMTWLAFDMFAGFIFLILPALMFLAVQGRKESVYITLVATVGFTVALAASDYGPFLLSTAEWSRLYLLTYLYTLIVLVLGTELYQRDLLSEVQARQSWQYRAHHDALTTLGNRSLFIPLLENEMKRAERMNRAFALALIDIDHFKGFNDSFGHALGDKVLREFAQLIRKNLRDIDVAARMGGDEFAILFPETPMSEARHAVERLRKQVEKLTIKYHGRTVNFTISSGLAEFIPHEAHTSDAILGRVDQLLYEAKRQGRNQVQA
ncbi:hypothetical protein C9927_03220 [Pseudidiomarina aestuarii]|uniref:diguanylate cyclase n=1 Tax=Pseudidiomarina aestuarii TaxID=624146 RepID=A0A2T4D4J9_9GAMM|nr:hypothetical protein C9986_00805 [Pseudidiomarina aestuarii]PTB84797.1 hypothetical protein C9988_03825 [Pseudidiomarina aestuarii]PTB88760.1 hypothetical protein C9927_03220 [Pseudidiomarina aestuarii]